MEGMGILANLKRQHEELALLADELLQEAEAAGSSYRMIMHRLSLFEGKLKIHLSMEDSHLYPRLMDHSDDGVRALTGGYVQEMGGIYDSFNAFLVRWKSDTPPEGFPALFRDEMKKLVGAVRRRIGREEEVLFPLLEARAPATGNEAGTGQGGTASRAGSRDD